MIVGITGSISSGKTTVTNYLISKNYNIIDCDQVSHEVIDTPIMIGYLVQYFGMEILNQETKKINRKLLGEIVFNDSIKKRKLELMMFPAIKKMVIEKISQMEGLIILVAPLLLESGFDSLVDKIIVVTIHPKIQLERLMKRDKISKEIATIKINSQWSSDRKRLYADYIVDNNGTIENTIEQIEKILEQIRSI